MTVKPPLFPRLGVLEWIVYTLLAAGLAVTNIYTTLLTGWGDGGSLVAVLASVLFLGLVTRKRPTVESLNLGQTMASAGGSVGFAVAGYAALKIAEPSFSAPTGELIVLFIVLGVVGTVVGSSVRKQMIRYSFPSGTACAVIQKTVTSEDGKAAKRPVGILASFGIGAALATIPTKISLVAGGSALVGSLRFAKGIGLSFEPLLYGIGLVVGPRIGLGMIIGAMSVPFVMKPLLEDAAVPAGSHVDWIRWLAIAVLTLPSFATIVLAYFFKQELPPLPGFTPGKTSYERPKSLLPVIGILFAFSGIAAAAVCQKVFGLPWYLTLLTVAVSWPLCIMNGRVSGDTDINPVRLVVIVLLSIFAVAVAGKVVALLGMAIIGGTLAGMGVDMMQDYRTGYLLDANPHHQTIIQFFGATAGSIAAVPFVLYLAENFGFGPGTAFAAPGGQMWAAMAKTFVGGAPLSSGLITMVVVASLVFTMLAALSVWPRTARFIPSLFGIGLGLLLSFEMCAAIFLGGLLKWGVTKFYVSRGENKPEALEAASNDTMLAGSAIFAASAIAAILVIVVAELGLWHVAK